MSNGIIKNKKIFIAGIALAITFVLSIGPILGNNNVLSKNSSNKDYLKFLDCMLDQQISHGGHFNNGFFSLDKHDVVRCFENNR
ncbi:MAG: hypothetical protein ACTHME_01735 [Candidatus Nitrosocosmicus sp.]